MDWIDDLITEGDAELDARMQQQIATSQERQFLSLNAVAVWDNLKSTIESNIKEINKRSNRTALLFKSVHTDSVQLCGQDHTPILDARFTPEAFQLVVSMDKETEKTIYKLEAMGVTSIGWRQQDEGQYITSALAQHIVSQAYRRTW